MTVEASHRAYRGRFAPSPTGRLHFGSLIAALGSYLRARSQNGQWLVRIEDLDPLREVPHASEEILQTLAAFGMVSDEPVLYQSTRTQVYTQAFEQLYSSGYIYPCWCSRALLQSNPIHQNTCIAPADIQRRSAWRLRAPAITIAFDDLLQGPQQQNLQQEVGDFIIQRVEGYFAYQLAVVVDDAAQGITEVVRGADLLDSTARQIYLQQVLNYPTPTYLHLPLVMDQTGMKLSKQDHAHPIDPHNPIPALRSALRFLDIDPPPTANTVSDLLEVGIHNFDIGSIGKR